MIRSSWYCLLRNFITSFWKFDIRNTNCSNICICMNDKSTSFASSKWFSVVHISRTFAKDNPVMMWTHTIPGIAYCNSTYNCVKEAISYSYVATIALLWFRRAQSLIHCHHLGSYLGLWSYPWVISMQSFCYKLSRTSQVHSIMRLVIIADTCPCVHSQVSL